MKKQALVLTLLLAMCAPAYAQPAQDRSPKPEGGRQGMMMDEGMMGMMSMMMGQGMMKGMMQDMMQMMMDMMDVHEKMMMGVGPDEKKAMIMDMTRMRQRMGSMMAMMTGQSPEGAMRMRCAEEWLRKAIDLHAVHLKDPKTATDESQLEMMEQMKKAYGCITDARMGDGGAGNGAPSSSKKDPHGH